jgi:hypothetical protein
MESIELSGLLNILGFIVGLIATVVLFGIVSRTKDDVRYGFLLTLLGMFAFVLFEAIRILEDFQIVNQAIIAEIFIIVFIALLVIGMWKLRTLIRGLSDFGQAFVIASSDKYDSKLMSIVKDVRNVCYVTLKEPYKKIVDVFDLYGIDTSSIQFIDASGEKCDADNCIEINNNPDDIKSTLDRVLKEKNIRSVIVDDVTALKKIESFQLPLFIQDTSSLIKANEAQGFFMCKIENLSTQTINDITMIVDKVIGE